MDPALEPTTPEDLGRTYAAMMADPAWPADAEATPAPDQVKADPPPDPLRILEAMLFVGGLPLTGERACEILRGLTPEQFAESIDTLNHDYRRQGRPYTIQAQEHGYRLALRPKFRGIIEKVYGGPREARLSTAAIDVLALVAYRQPATKAEIDGLRGAESGPLLRQLVRRGLLEVTYRGEATPTDGKAKGEVSYGTSPRFLQLFGLSNLDDLPRTQDLQQM